MSKSLDTSPLKESVCLENVPGAFCFLIEAFEAKVRLNLSDK